MLTEQEARTKWCPMARVARFGIEKSELGNTVEAIVGSCNRDALGKSPNPIGSCRCIASDCMMWRWDIASEGHCGLAGPMEAPT